MEGANDDTILNPALALLFKAVTADKLTDLGNQVSPALPSNNAKSTHIGVLAEISVLY